MKKSLRQTIAFICALTLTAAPLTLSSHSLSAFAKETVTVQSESGEVTQEQIEKNIIGTWVLAETDGQPALTNDRSVFTIVSPTEAYSSVSRLNAQGSPWHSHTECDITIDGNVVTITNHTESGTTIEHQFAITEISADSFTANRTFTRSSKNAEPRVTEDVVTFVKAEENAEIVCGTWQGVCTSGEYEFDDGNEHRWEYKPDGTYVYYDKVGDEWVPVDSANCEYFVAGNLMFTRWFDQDGKEYREQWEFTVENGKLSWTALRANEDGSTYTATFEMNKVEENSGEVTQEQIEKNIVGTWILAEKDGEDALTNEKSVYTIVSPTEAYTSVSRVLTNRSPWHAPSQCGISIDGNVVTLNIENGRKIEYQFTITDIDSDTFTANRKFTRSFEDSEPILIDDVVTFVKVDDLSEAVFGTWEGKCTSEGSVFDDGKEHRWEYKPYGTYVYYNKDGDEWVKSDNTLNEYFVAGNLLCMRWVDNGTEHREWWEISVEDGKMSWTALRANEDGSTYNASFEMNKIKGSFNLRPVHLCDSGYVIDMTDEFVEDETPKPSDIDCTMSAFYKAVNEEHGIGIFQFAKNEDEPETLKEYADAMASADNSTAQKCEFNGIEAYSYKAVREYNGGQYDTVTYILDSEDSFVKLFFWSDDETSETGSLRAMSSLRVGRKLKTVSLGSSPFSINIPEEFTLDENPVPEDVENGMTAFYQSDNEGHGVGIFQNAKNEATSTTLKEYADGVAAEYDSTAQRYEINGIEVYNYKAVKEYQGKKFDTNNYIFEAGNTFIEISYWPENEMAEAGSVKAMNSLKKETLVPVKISDSIYSVSMFESIKKTEPTDDLKESGMTAAYKSAFSSLYVETFRFMKSGDKYDTFENFANNEAAKNDSQAKKESLNGVEAYSYESFEEYDGVKYPTKTYILDSVDSFVTLKYRLADDDAAYEMEKMLSTLTKESVTSDFITPERMCEMAEKDYQKKNRNTEVSAEIGTKNDDGTVDILLKDEAGNTVDTYTVDQKTGEGSNADGGEVDLPQTGMSGAHKAFAGMAALMTLTGAALIKKSKKEDEE